MLLAWLRHATQTLYIHTLPLIIRTGLAPPCTCTLHTLTHSLYTQTLTLHSRLTVIMIDVHIRSEIPSSGMREFTLFRTPHGGDESSVPSSAATAEEKSGCETSDESGRTLTLRRKIRHGA